MKPVTRKELLDALLALEKEMAEMERNNENSSDYDSKYQQKNREWQRLYDAVLDAE